MGWQACNGGQPRNAGWQEAAREAQLKKQRMASCKGRAADGPPDNQLQVAGSSAEKHCDGKLQAARGRHQKK